MSFSSNDWSNLLSLVLLIVTGAYVYLTWKIANANQSMLERVETQHLEQIRPAVYAFLGFRGQVVVRLVIRNMGKTPAKQLRISLDRDFYQFGELGGRNLRDFPLFNEVTEWFPPGAEISVDLTQGFNLDKIADDKNLTPSQFVVELKYQSKFAEYEENCRIDMAPYRNMHVPKTTNEQLDGINTQLQKMNEHFSKSRAKN